MRKQLTIIKIVSKAKGFFEKYFYWIMFWGFVDLFPAGFFKLLSNPVLKIFGNILYFIAASVISIGFWFYIKSYFRKKSA